MQNMKSRISYDLFLNFKETHMQCLQNYLRLMSDAQRLAVQEEYIV